MKTVTLRNLNAPVKEGQEEGIVEGKRYRTFGAKKQRIFEDGTVEKWDFRVRAPDGSKGYWREAGTYLHLGHTLKAEGFEPMVYELLVEAFGGEGGLAAVQDLDLKNPSLDTIQVAMAEVLPTQQEKKDVGTPPEAKEPETMAPEPELVVKVLPTGSPFESSERLDIVPFIPEKTGIVATIKALLPEVALVIIVFFASMFFLMNNK